MNTRRGFAIAIVLGYSVLAAGAGYLSLKGWELFHPKAPDLAGLTADQQKLAAAQQAAVEAEAKLQATLLAAQQAKDAQTRSGQQMVAGVGKALAQVPASPATTLALGLNTRAQVALAAAIGGLPQSQQDEINTIVAEALSQSQAQVADAQAKLAAKDADLQVTNVARQQAEQKATQLAVTVASAEAAQSAAQSTLTAKTNEVKTWAQAKVDSDAHGDLLSNYVRRLVLLLACLCVAYLFVHFMLPSLAAQYPAVRSIVGLYNVVTSLTSAHTVSVPPTS